MFDVFVWPFTGRFVQEQRRHSGEDRAALDGHQEAESDAHRLHQAAGEAQERERSHRVHTQATSECDVIFFLVFLFVQNSKRVYVH